MATRKREWVRWPHPAKPVLGPLPEFEVGARVRTIEGGYVGEVIAAGRRHDGVQVLAIKWDRDPDASELPAYEVVYAPANG